MKCDLCGALGHNSDACPEADVVATRDAPVKRQPTAVEVRHRKMWEQLTATKLPYYVQLQRRAMRAWLATHDHVLDRVDIFPHDGFGGAAVPTFTILRRAT